MNFEEVKGKKAKDRITGIEGTITAMCFYEDGYTSVRLEYVNDKKELCSEWFAHNRIDLM